LEVIEIHPEVNEIYIKGAIPGGRNALVLISGEGELKLKTTVVENSAPVVEAVPELVVAEQAA
jgi:ribosomal protein L3